MSDVQTKTLRAMAEARVLDQRALVAEVESDLRALRRDLWRLERELEAYDYGAQITVYDLIAREREREPVA